MNDQPPNPAADEPTAFQPPATDPTAPPRPSATEWPADGGHAWNPADTSAAPGAPGDPFAAPGGDPYGAQPGAPYGTQPGAPYGAQPGPAYGGQQPGAYPGFPSPGAPGHPAPGSGGTSGFAIASLIFGILGGILLSVIFGIVALVQIRKRGQTGRGMAIAGLTLSGCWILLIIVGVTAAIISDSGNDGNTGSGTGSGTVAVTTLQRGDCINGIQSSAAIEDLPVVPCTQPHEGEVYAVFELPAGPWPGDTAVQEQSEKRCKAEFKSYAPNAADSVDVLYLHPLRESWTRDRGVTCVATDDRGTTTGSVRD